MPSFTFTSPEGKNYTVEGQEGATKEQAWNILQQQIQPAAPEKPQISTMQAIGKSLEQAVVPTLTGALTGAATGAAAGTFFPGVGNVIGAIAGGIGGGFAGSYAQEKALEAAPETAKALGLSPEERQASREQHPIATALAEAAPNLLLMRPSTEIANLFKAGATEAEKALGRQAAANAAAGSALSGTIDLGQQVLSGQPIDPTSALIAAGTGALGMKETALGRAVNVPAQRLGERIAGAKETAPVVEMPPPKQPTEAKVPESDWQDTNEAMNELKGKTKTPEETSDLETKKEGATEQPGEATPPKTPETIADLEANKEGTTEQTGEAPPSKTPEETADLEANKEGTTERAGEVPLEEKINPKQRVDANGVPLHDLEFGTKEDLDLTPIEQMEKISSIQHDALKDGVHLIYDRDDNSGSLRIDPINTQISQSLIKNAGTVGEFAKTVEKYMPLHYQEILQHILPDIQDVKIGLSKNKEVASKGTAGMYLPLTHAIKLFENNASATKLQTIVHEIIHAATERNYLAGKRVTHLFELNFDENNIDKREQAAKDLDKLFYSLKYDKNLSVKRGLLLTVGGNIFQHPTELITWGLTNPNVQSILKTIYLGENKTAWSSFVSSIRKLLGLKESQTDSLTKVIDISERLMGKIPIAEGRESRPGRTLPEWKVKSGLNSEKFVPRYLEVNARNAEQEFSNPSAILRQSIKSHLDEAPSWWDKFMYYMVNKHIDLKNMHDAIIKGGKTLPDKFNAWLQHTLSTNRRNHMTTEYARNEVTPLMKKLKEYGLSIDQLDEFLHNAHAEERNIQNNKTNVDENGDPINSNIVDRGSGIHTDDARTYLNGLSPEKRAQFDDLAKDVRKMVNKTQDMLVASGQEKPETIEKWRETYDKYVPLFREADELNFTHQGTGTGGGYSSIGNTTKRAVGSTKTVGDIIENIGLQRIRAINRAEDIKVGQALYGQLLQHPMAGFAQVVNPDVVKNKVRAKAELEQMGLAPELVDRILVPPKKGSINSRTGLTEYRMDSSIRSAANVLPVRINGEDRYIIFNTADPVAMRMVGALKNADAATIPPFMRWIARGTHFLSSVNTQYNPVFGAWNFMRDTQAGLVNLASTPLKNDVRQVTAGTFPALKAIYGELRARRQGGTTTGDWADAYREFEKSGGKLDFGTRIMDNEGKANLFASQLKDLNPKNVQKVTRTMMGWLSDYNDSMENAVRLSTFKTAVDKGISVDKASALANNITVNFNQKGQLTPYFSSIFSFFNAGVQGTERLAQTLNSPAGRKIVAGGLAIGAGQALALAAAGFDDSDIPDYIKEKNLVIPTGNGKYVVAPLPPGLNIIPNASRNITEFVLGQAGVIRSHDSAAGKALKIGSSLMGSFDPLGTGPIAQQLTPTLLRPVVAAGMNQDAFGRPISRPDQPGRPVPGYLRSRDNASTLGKYMAEYLNYASGGTQFQKGSISPTGDDLDYLTGQYLGGVSREAMKAAETTKSLMTGEEQPNYRMPIVGKLYGDVNSAQDIANRFYQNAERMAGYKAEIQGRVKTPESGNPRDVIRENPEAALYQTADNVHSQIVKLNQQKKLLQVKNAPVSRIKQIEETKTRIMKRFNDAVQSRQ